MRAKSSTSKNSESGESERAWAYAVRLLSRRDYTVAEFVRKLGERGFAAEASEAAIARMIRSGYLDDRRFAERWAETLVKSGRGYGPRLRQELTRRGIPRDIVAEVVAAVTAAYGERELLAEIMARKFAGYDAAAASVRDRGRVIAYLQRRGFSLPAILDYLRTGSTTDFPQD